MNLDIQQRSDLCDSHREEVASVLTHAFGVLVSIVSLVFMLVVSAGDAVRVVSSLVFGVSLILLYLSSSLYHLFTSVRWKAHFQALDHACIYLLIAGSYTPITLITLKGPWGWTLFGIVWVMAVVGISIKLFSKGRKDHWISTALYLAMGWVVVIAIGQLLQKMPGPGMVLLVAGGLSYTLGIAFFVWNKLPFNHAIWHLFVLGGSVCHVLAVTLHVLR